MSIQELRDDWDVYRYGIVWLWSKGDNVTAGCIQCRLPSWLGKKMSGGALGMDVWLIHVDTGYGQHELDILWHIHIPAPKKIGLAGESTFLLTAKIKDDQSTTKYQTASFTQAKKNKVNFRLKNVHSCRMVCWVTKHHRGVAVFHTEKWDVEHSRNGKHVPLMF